MRQTILNSFSLIGTYVQNKLSFSQANLGVSVILLSHLNLCSTSDRALLSKIDTEVVAMTESASNFPLPGSW